MKFEYYLECKIDEHNKFWEIKWDNTSTESTVRFGPIGARGTSKTKKVGDDAVEAHAANLALLNGKIRKGYLVVKSTTARPDAPTVPGLKVIPCLEIL